MKDLERQLEELEGRHSGLSQSYESLQQEYSYVKAELDVLRKENSRLEKEKRDSKATSTNEWDQSQYANCDPLLFQTMDSWSGEYGESSRQH